MLRSEIGLEVGLLGRNSLVVNGGEGENRVGVVGGQKLLLVLVVKLEVMLKELKKTK